MSTPTYSAIFKSVLETNKDFVVSSLSNATFEMNKTHGYIYMNSLNKILVTFGTDNSAEAKIVVGQYSWDIQATVDLVQDTISQINSILSAV